MSFEKDKFQEYLDNYCSLRKKTLAKYNKTFWKMEDKYWSRVVRFYRSIEKWNFIEMDKFLKLSNKEFVMNCKSHIKKIKKVKYKKRTALECKVIRKQTKTQKQIDYIRYLRSNTWKQMRRTYLFKCNNICACCKKYHKDNELHLHHHTYERFKKERESDLVIVCESCHKNIHTTNWKKTPMQEKYLRARFEELKIK